MGSGASHILFDYQYDHERKLLRQNLIQQFEKNPRHQDLLTKIQLVRDILTQHAHICETAVRELQQQQDDEAGPTNPQAAYNELDRLLTIYETSTILKSVQCRIGPVACPLGHYAAYFDNFEILIVNKKKKLQCHICKKDVQDGYHCGYCMYNLCVPCSVVYCSYAHPMKLWTHPESDLTCEICKKEPIHSGYRCVICDIDFCDYCTWKEGRKAVAQIVHDRMAKDLEYIENHQDESETAFKTISTHRKKVAEDSYPTIKHLYEFSLSLHEIQEICVAEVRQTRITRAIQKYRAVLTYGKEYSKTAYEESLIVDNYTQEEQERLEELLKKHEYLKSVSYRSTCKVGCPLGHGAIAFHGIPEAYQSRIPKEKKTSRPDVLCRICRRNASPGNYCEYCEYDLCNTCSVIYCAEGHPMKMWTEPASIETCFLCKKSPITSGYRCSRCNVDLCDLCTTKEGRDRIRTNWETEMTQLLRFMTLNRRFSDIALFYEWRHANQIASIGLLVDTVKELRTAKKKAEKQIEQKSIIDKIKVLRSEIIKHPELCMTAAREASRSDIFVFATKAKAVEEMKRLSDILRAMILAQSPEERSKYGIACPLSHGMIPIEYTYLDDNDETNVLVDAFMTTSNGLSDRQSSLPQIMMVDSEEKESPSREKKEKDDESNDKQIPQEKKQTAAEGSTKIKSVKEIRSKSEAAEEEEAGGKFSSSSQFITPWRASSKKFDEFLENQLSRPASPTNAITTTTITTLDKKEKKTTNSSALITFPPKAQARQCRICASTVLNGGHTCTICEYDLCYDCSTVYCRSGHPLKIWTMPEAQSLSCELCKTSPIIAGYRCLLCNIDICDLCTTRESRNAFMLWPRREYHRILDYLQSMKEQSKIAEGYLMDTDSESMKEYLTSMSKLCRKLQEAMEVKRQVEREIQQAGGIYST